MATTKIEPGDFNYLTHNLQHLSTYDVGNYLERNELEGPVTFEEGIDDPAKVRVWRVEHNRSIHGLRTIWHEDEIEPDPNRILSEMQRDSRFSCPQLSKDSAVPEEIAWMPGHEPKAKRSRSKAKTEEPAEAEVPN